MALPSHSLTLPFTLSFTHFSREETEARSLFIKPEKGKQ